MDKLDLYTKALCLRKELGEDSESPINIFSLTQYISNLTLVFYPMGGNLSGMCIKNDGSPVIAINSKMSLGRQRFSMAHELFHLYFDKGIDSSVSPMSIGEVVEKEADTFASYFLITPFALDVALKKIMPNTDYPLTIKEIVWLEQYFGVSRKAILYRLIGDGRLTHLQAESYWQDVICSALSLGYDDTLYKPTPVNKQYMTYGYFIQQAKEAFEKDLISNGKYEQLLLTAFRTDLVYGDEIDGSELND